LNRIVEKMREDEVLNQYPINGSLQGWFFRLEETSNCAWTAEGTDLWGRKVSCQGTDEDSTLEKCVAMAVQIRDEVLAAKGARNSEA
jgi:hypothetical protein